MSLSQGTDPHHEILWQLLDHNLAQWDVTHMARAGDAASGGLHLLVARTLSVGGRFSRHRRAGEQARFSPVRAASPDPIRAAPGP